LDERELKNIENEKHAGFSGKWVYSKFGKIQIDSLIGILLGHDQF
jgi:hypothetical protein